MASIYKHKSGWRAQVRRQGLPVKTKLFGSKQDAERWAYRVETAVSQDGFLDLEEAKRTTLAEALDRYEREETCLKKSADVERYRIGAWKRDPLANRVLSSIRSSDIAAWRSAKEKAGAAPSTIKNSLNIISRVFAVAATDWGMEGLRNPVRNVRMPKARPGRERRLELGEEDRLLEACEGSPLPYLRSLFVVAIETGMRQGELLGLMRSDINGNRACLHQTKNGERRIVPLSSRVLAALEAIPVSLDGRVFPVSRWQLRHFWEDACRQAGVEDLRWHDLRHEATSRLFERGLSTEQVMKVTGHKTHAMLARYTHLKDDAILVLLG